MRNQYFVNVPVDGNIYVKKKKDKRLRNPTESRKRTQQLPLMPHFTTQQPAGKNGNYHQQKMKYMYLQPIISRNQNMSPQLIVQLAINQPSQKLTNKHQTTKQTANIQPNQHPKVNPAKNQ